MQPVAIDDKPEVRVRGFVSVETKKNSMKQIFGFLFFFLFFFFFLRFITFSFPIAYNTFATVLVLFVRYRDILRSFFHAFYSSFQ